MSRESTPPQPRSAYRWFVPITTRWLDNDVYGHINNAIYYSWIDTAVNSYLLTNGLLDIDSSPVIGLVAETGCRYLSSITYPEAVTMGVRIAHLGNSSARYDVAVFREDDDTPSAVAHFVHVYVDRVTMRPVSMPAHLRAGLERIAA
jgi:acyl-CoA thioester hydrolase